MRAGVKVTRIELVLVNGSVRALDLPAGTSSIANALARLDDWIETADGGWVQKSYVVEVRNPKHGETVGATLEYEALDVAAAAIADRARENRTPSGLQDRDNARTQPGLERGA
jgi:hypothetical protein